MIHFVKRELETLLYVDSYTSLDMLKICSFPSVHRFSHATMPVFNLLKKSVLTCVLFYYIISYFLLAHFTITSYLVFSLPSTYIVSNIRLLPLTSLIPFVITGDSYGYSRVFGPYVLFFICIGNIYFLSPASSSSFQTSILT